MVRTSNFTRSNISDCFYWGVPCDADDFDLEPQADRPPYASVSGPGYKLFARRSEFELADFLD